MEFKNLLIFRIGNLGDTVVGLPALWAIRKSMPNARLTLLTNYDPNYLSPLDVLPTDELLDDFITYPSDKDLLRKSVYNVLLCFKLRRKKFDAVIYLMPRLRTLAQIDRDVRFFRASGISNVVGAEYSRQNRLSSEVPKPTPSVESEANYLLGLLRNEGLLTDGIRPKPDMRLKEIEFAAAKQIWENLRTEDVEGKTIVAVAPGSKWESKIWDEERYAEVVSKLILHYNCYPIIFGGKEDREKGDRLLARWKTGTNLAGRLTVRESAALLRDCSLYLGNDTGTMHLASAVETPCVAIFAAIDWKGRWYPFGDNNVVFRESVECEGCLSPHCFNQHKCLKLVSADEVYDACVRVLSKSRSSV